MGVYHAIYSCDEKSRVWRNGAKTNLAETQVSERHNLLMERLLGRIADSLACTTSSGRTPIDHISIYTVVLGGDFDLTNGHGVNVSVLLFLRLTYLD